MDGPLRSPPSFYPYGVHMRSRKSFRLPLKLLLLPLMIVAVLSLSCFVSVLLFIPFSLYTSLHVDCLHIYLLFIFYRIFLFIASVDQFILPSSSPNFLPTLHLFQFPSLPPALSVSLCLRPLQQQSIRLTPIVRYSISR